MVCFTVEAPAAYNRDTHWVISSSGLTECSICSTCDSWVSSLTKISKIKQKSFLCFYCLLAQSVEFLHNFIIVGYFLLFFNHFFLIGYRQHSSPPYIYSFSVCPCTAVSCLVLCFSYVLVHVSLTIITWFFQ